MNKSAARKSRSNTRNNCDDLNKITGDSNDDLAPSAPSATTAAFSGLTRTATKTSTVVRRRTRTSTGQQEEPGGSARNVFVFNGKSSHRKSSPTTLAKNRPSQGRITRNSTGRKQEPSTSHVTAESTTRYTINTRQTRRSGPSCNYTDNVSEYYSNLIKVNPVENSTSTSTNNNKSLFREVNEKYSEKLQESTDAKSKDRSEQSSPKSVVYLNKSVSSQSTNSRSNQQQNNKSDAVLVDKSVDYEIESEDIPNNPKHSRPKTSLKSIKSLITSLQNRPVTRPRKSPRIHVSHQITFEELYQRSFKPRLSFRSTLDRSIAKLRLNVIKVNDKMQRGILTDTPESTKRKHAETDQPENEIDLNTVRPFTPSTWVFHTPDKQKLAAIRPPVSVIDKLIPGMIIPAFKKQCRTVYMVNPKEVDVTTLSPGSQIAVDRSELSEAIGSIPAGFRVGGDGAEEDEEEDDDDDDDDELGEDKNEFQMCGEERSFDFNCGGGERGLGRDVEGRVAVDQWERDQQLSRGFEKSMRMKMASGGSNLPALIESPASASTSFSMATSPPPPPPLHNIHLQVIHDAATQRPTKTQSRLDRRQYLDRKSLTFEDSTSTSNENENTTPTSSDRKKFKSRALSADSLTDRDYELWRHGNFSINHSPFNPSNFPTPNDNVTFTSGSSNDFIPTVPTCSNLLPHTFRSPFSTMSHTNTNHNTTYLNNNYATTTNNNNNNSTITSGAYERQQQQLPRYHCAEKLQFQQDDTSSGTTSSENCLKSSSSSSSSSSAENWSFLLSAGGGQNDSESVSVIDSPKWFPRRNYNA